MTGLLRNNFYGVISNVKLFLVLDMALYVVLVISGNDSLMTILSIITAPSLSLLAISGLRKENSSKWGKYKLTMPVTRTEIIKSQFIMHLVWTGLGIVGTAVFMSLTVLIHGNLYFAYGLRDAATLVMCGGVLSILVGATSYPLLYFLGTERTEAILIASVIASIAIVFGLTMGINSFLGTGNVTNFEYYMSVVIILVISSILYVISYFVTIAIFKTEEY